MSVPTCPEVRELAPELALGIVGGPERAEALQHASECGPCRALVGELAEAADALTLLAAEAPRRRQHPRRTRLLGWRRGPTRQCDGYRRARRRGRHGRV